MRLHGGVYSGYRPARAADLDREEDDVAGKHRARRRHDGRFPATLGRLVHDEGEAGGHGTRSAPGGMTAEALRTRSAGNPSTKTADASSAIT
ncbi:MAG: hypothetical protein E6J75_13985 [Deltaproteobacteria bacterium]|nr:MAG: hypothetical protein E6J75_13985 [Deltaproteobacteria bacterium]